MMALRFNKHIVKHGVRTDDIITAKIMARGNEAATSSSLTVAGGSFDNDIPGSVGTPLETSSSTRRL
jgi:hypothetical protein